MDRFLFPIDILQAEKTNLAAAKTEHDQERQDSVVANVCRCVTSRCDDQALHITPLRPSWYAFETADSWSINRGS